MASDSNHEGPVKAEPDGSGFSSDENSLLNGSDAMTGRQIPALTDLPPTKETKTNMLFSKSQRKYLASLKLEYKETKEQNLRAELALSAAEFMLRRLEKAGVKKSKAEKSAFRLHVRRWFQQNCRAEKDLPSFAYAWTGRRVFYHKHQEKVLAEWRLLCRAAGVAVPDSNAGLDIPSNESSEDEEAPSEPLSAVADDTKQAGTSGSASEPPKAPKRPPVKFFQTALSNVYGRLPPSLRKTYERQAIEWKLQGPDEATKRRLAENQLPRLARHFASTVHQQMGVRLAILATYVVPNGNTAASFLDYTEEFGGRSFSKDYGPELERSGILSHWGAYAKGVFEDGEDSDKAEEGQIRKRGKPLLKLELNKYGEPVIPDPKLVPAGEQPNQYLGRLIRNIVIYNYARSCGREPKDVGPPWARMAENVRNFISSEYLPDELVPHWKEPTNINVKPARQILQYWYDRQLANKIPLEIHTYWDGDKLVPREPRQLLAADDNDPDFEDDVETFEVPKLAKSRKKATRTAAKSRPNVKDGLGDREAESVLEAEVPSAVAEDGPVPTGPANTRQSRTQGRTRQIVQSDSESETAPKSQSPPIAPPPSKTPSVRSNSSHSSAVQLRLDTLAADPDLAGLDESVRKLALGVLQRHISTSIPPLSPIPGSSMEVDRSSELDRPVGSTHPQLPSSSPKPDAPAAQDAGPSAKNKQRATQTRRRKTEEEILLEMAAAAGAKSGPRRTRKAPKARE